MSTPIEIVREQWDWMRADGIDFMVQPHTWEDYDTALASVLRDAERFKRLEKALKDDAIYVSTPVPHEDDVWAPHNGTLAELADRLMEEKTTT